MLADVPHDWTTFSEWRWSQIAPLTTELLQRPITPDTLDSWLRDWTRLACLISETFNRLQIRTTTHTGDEAGQRRFREYSEDVMPSARAFEQAMKTRLLDSGLQPAGFDVPLRRMRSDAAMYRDANLALKTETERLMAEFQVLTAARTVEWDGRDLTQPEVVTRLADADRGTRERAWRALSACLASQRSATDALWTQLLDLRTEMATNAGFADYRSYRWNELGRFDYTPLDCMGFHAAIQEVVVPAVQVLIERRREGLGVSELRVWDDHWWIRPDSAGRPALRPFGSVQELTATIERIFSCLHPDFASYYRLMREEGLLDLDARAGKAQGGYMEELPASKRAFIFTTAVGSSPDVRTQLHEAGHAFHVFDASHWPYHYQSMLEYMPMEFKECAAMGMELLASPYLASEQGGFYSGPQLAQERLEHLTEILEFWPYMAVVDAFQHWVYENPAAARNPDQCDETWAKLHRRFMPHFDWTGLEDSLRLSWRLQDHIMIYPLYYVEYGMAQLGAIQIWANAIRNEEEAIAAYRTALSLGNTASLPELYRAAGVRFDFGRDTLIRAVQLIQQTLDHLK